MLLVDNHPLLCQDDPISEILQTPSVWLAVSDYLTKPPALAQAEARPVMVKQREEAGARYHEYDEVIIGSEGATTCLIVVAACPRTQVAWAAHYDSYETCASSMLLQAIGSMLEPQLFLVGAYGEPSGRSRSLLHTVLNILHTHPTRIHLRLACVDLLNIRDDGAPAAQHLVVHLPSLQAAPATFHHRPPQELRRDAQLLCLRGPMLCISTPADTRLHFQGFDPRLPSWTLMHHERQLHMPDSELLQLTSTSPAHELPDYLNHVRAAIHWLLEAQENPAIAEQHLTYVWDAIHGYVQCSSTSCTWQA